MPDNYIHCDYDKENGFTFDGKTVPVPVAMVMYECMGNYRHSSRHHVCYSEEFCKQIGKIIS